MQGALHVASARESAFAARLCRRWRDRLLNRVWPGSAAWNGSLRGVRLGWSFVSCGWIGDLGSLILGGLWKVPPFALLVLTFLSSESLLKITIRAKCIFHFLANSPIISGDPALAKFGNKAPISMFYSCSPCGEVRWSVHPHLSSHKVALQALRLRN